MRRAFRRLHRKVSPWLFALVAVSAVTGIVFRAGKKWFGMDRETGHAVMEWHTGAWLGEGFSPFYVLLVGGSLVFLLVTGAALLWQKGGGLPLRRGHRVLAVILLLPLAVTAVTGVAVEVGQAWFGMGEETADFLMMLHEGGWLGKKYKVFYSVCVGGGVLALGFMGLLLLRKRRPAAKKGEAGIF
jgi:hypothetical protein